VHLWGRHRGKLRIAAARGVGTHLAGKRMPVAAFDYVVEATGSADGLRTAAAMTRPRGTLVVKSTVHGDVAIDTAGVIVNEITLVGSRCGRFSPALRLLRGRKIDVEPMIADRFPLAGAPEAFRRAAERGVLKVLLLGEG